MKKLKIASWNVCLGVSNKLEYITRLLNSDQIDVLFIQEAEIRNQTNIEFYKVKNYTLIISNTLPDGKARLCCYVKNDVKFQVNTVQNNVIELISIKISDLTINGIYRPFRTPHHNNQVEYFTDLINGMRDIQRTKYNFLIGDFNLDSSKRNEQNYQHHHLHDLLDDYLDDHNLIQIESDFTWTRIVNNNVKTSTLDHLYTNDMSIVKKFVNEKQAISDHNLICATIDYNLRRNNLEKKI